MQQVQCIHLYKSYVSILQTTKIHYVDIQEEASICQIRLYSEVEFFLRDLTKVRKEQNTLK
jgi:hypothetical protein